MQYNKKKPNNIIILLTINTDSNNIYWDSPERTAEVQFESVRKKDRGQLQGMKLQTQECG